MFAAQVFVWRPDKGGECHRAFFEDPLAWPKMRAPTGLRRNNPYPLRFTMDALLRGVRVYHAYMAELKAAQAALVAVPERSTKVIPSHNPASCVCSYACVHGILQSKAQTLAAKMTLSALALGS